MKKNLKKNILILIGTRPEAIKLIPIYLELKKQSWLNVKLCATSQHKDMLKQVLDLFNVVADIDLNIMKHNQSLFSLSANILLKLQQVLEQLKPDLIIVQGDTTTSAFGAIAAFYMKIPIAHVEAGLRTHNNYSPWPEEFNRKVISLISHIHFAPTIHAKNNLIAENISQKNIFVTGNTIVDAIKIITKKIKQNKQIQQILKENFSFIHNKDNIYILVTAHRRENFGTNIKNICFAIKKLVNTINNIEFIYPVHPNPNIKKTVYKILSKHPRIHLLNPLDYISFLYLLEKCYLILSDSGGLQEETPSFKKPLLILRDTTERPEAIEVGTAKLIGTKIDNIYNHVLTLLNNKAAYKKMQKNKNPFGDGKATIRICNIIKKYFSN